MSSLRNRENPLCTRKNVVRYSPPSGNFQDRKEMTMLPGKWKPGWREAEWNYPNWTSAKIKVYHLYKLGSLDQEAGCSFPLINEPPKSIAIWSPCWADWMKYFPLSSTTWQISSWEKFHLRESVLLTSRQWAILIFISFLSLPPTLVRLQILGSEGLWTCHISLLMFA